MTDEELQHLMTVAERVRDALKDNEELKVPELASALGETTGTIHYVLDSHLVNEDGSVEHVGSGRGGNWVPQPPEAEADNSIRTVEDIIAKDVEEGIITGEQGQTALEQYRQHRDAQETENG